jgi:hypothetical protein
MINHSPIQPLIIFPAMDYGRRFTHSLAITWRHKSWWLLGALLGVVILPQLAAVRALLTLAVRANELDEAALTAAITARMESFLQPGQLLLWFIVLLVVTAVIWLATAVAEGGLIWAVNEQEEGRSVTLLAALRGGWRFLIRLIALDAVIFLPLFLLLLLGLLLGSGGLIGGILLAAQEGAALEGALLVMAGGGGLFFCLSLLALPLGVLTFIYRFIAFRAAIVEDLPAGASLRRAGRLFRNHWLTFIILAILIWGARYAVRTAASFILTPLYMVSFQLALSRGGLFANLLGLTADLGNYFLFAMLILFNAVAWTVFYRAIIAPEPEREVLT